MLLAPLFCGRVLVKENMSFLRLTRQSILLSRVFLLAFTTFARLPRMTIALTAQLLAVLEIIIDTMQFGQSDQNRS